ncbi:predicted protein [Streptomyces sp. C]|nr:predicted protein [Streptomyces sp. C]
MIGTVLRPPVEPMLAQAAEALGPGRTAGRLRAMFAPGHPPREELVNWMTLVARHARSSGAPGAASLPVRSVPRRVVTGEHDVFLPPRRLGPAVRGTLGAELGVVPAAGRLVVEERPEYQAPCWRVRASQPPISVGVADDPWLALADDPAGEDTLLRSPLVRGGPAGRPCGEAVREGVGGEHGGCGGARHVGQERASELGRDYGG